MATEFSATSIWSNCFETAASFDGEFAGSIRTRRKHFPAELAAIKASQLSSSRDGLLYALIRSRASKCEDTRDNVYSQLRPGNADIFPTYDDDEAQVYITAATSVLQHSDKLLLLTCAEGAEFQTMPDLPSWVPDWSVSKDLGLCVSGYRHFSAAGSHPRHCSLTNGRRNLQIQTAKVDTITRSAETKGDLLDFSHPTRLWSMLAELDDTYTPTGQSKEEALWRTLITDRGHALHSDTITYIVSRVPLAAARLLREVDSLPLPSPHRRFAIARLELLPCAQRFRKHAYPARWNPRVRQASVGGGPIGRRERRCCVPLALLARAICAPVPHAAVAPRSGHAVVERRG